MNCIFYLIYFLSIYWKENHFKQSELIKGQERIRDIRGGYVSLSPCVRKLLKDKIDKENELKQLQEAESLLEKLQESEKKDRADRA